MFKKLLVPLDGSPLAEQALAQAGAIARTSRASIELVLVHQPSGPLGTKGEPLREADVWHMQDRYMETIAHELRRETGVPVAYCVPRGNPTAMICARADAVSADLIVMTSHGRTGFNRLWMGSVADGVVRRSSIPILMLRSSKRQTPRAAGPAIKRILVTLDGSAHAVGVLSAASDLARTENARLVLLRVVQPVPLALVEPNAVWTYVAYLPDQDSTRRLEDEARRDLSDTEQILLASGVNDFESHVVVAPAVPQAIIDFAATHNIDVIAMSSHGRGMSRLIVGSVADKVLRGSGLPVLLRRPASIALEPPLLTTTSVEEQVPALADVGGLDPIC